MACPAPRPPNRRCCPVRRRQDRGSPRALRGAVRIPPDPSWEEWSGSVPARCRRSEEHTSELQSLMRISYAVFCLKKKNKEKTKYKYKIKSIIERMSNREQ